MSKMAKTAKTDSLFLTKKVYSYEGEKGEGRGPKKKGEGRGQEREEKQQLWDERKQEISNI